ncbi:ubiquinone/menaquinone biosynthesis C-methylase UbiE [Actinomadura hallensis]|mgnify:CR=1 FL=1|uniref:Ubiquinone/menaquinone biosynthesis C-methylase UbiE n=1 Tax=Actinomadura hallensis TaxID=337895 RepID=A0A543IP06_9ACTN|nr:class I SAM-dependent methyltransferase [Actinomadura hallensis]TQM72300.1 ubiquinone/menaquinone biosynthesis C-methylase UbiE [Actinomadura hallensis]HLV74688.1 class I SAM-dependent methyltransferase [Vulgatibacteraceae bacterium]
MVQDFDAYERELWAGRADAYEKGFARVTRHMVGPLLDAAGVMEGTRFLDVGTGPGVVAAEAVRRGAAVSAMDADTGMAEVARRNVPGLDVRIAVLPEVPFGDGEFDAVAGNFVINHVGDPGRALTALRRVLRPGGRLALSCWRMPGSGVLGIVRDAIEEAGVPWPDDIPEPPFMEHGEPAAFRRLVAGAGFREVAVEEVTWEHLVDPQRWWELGALARVGSNGVVVGRQDAPTVARIKDAYDRIVAGYAVADGRVALPAHALLASAVR